MIRPGHPTRPNPHPQSEPSAEKQRSRAASRPASLFIAIAAAATVWSWRPQTSGTSADLRGVSAIGAGTVWASGTKGTWLRTVDGGNTWRASQVPAAGELDFRDVEAFDSENAWLMSAGEGSLSRIYRTRDGGGLWTLSLQNPDPKGFFDAIAFWSRDRGLVLGDPVNGRFVVLTAQDGGAHWTPVEPSRMPLALAGEGAFAASGTCLVAGPGGRAWFGTGGGGTARVFRTADEGRTWTASTTPLPAQTPSSGIFSLAFWDLDHGIAVGGDYRSPRSSSAIAVTQDGGATWRAVAAPAPVDRFLSAVVVVPDTHPAILVATGPGISAWSADGGLSWHAGSGGYNALSFAGPLAGWAVGPAGAIACLTETVAADWRR